MSQPTSKASQVFEFNTHELPRRAGEMKEYQLDLEILEPIGVPLVSVPAGDVIELDLRLESVTEGVLLSADLYAIAKGECIRCLDPVEITVERKIQELYRYEPSKDSGKKGKKSKRASDDDVDLEEDDELWMDGNVMDLEPPIRDAVVLDLPLKIALGSVLIAVKSGRICRKTTSTRRLTLAGRAWLGWILRKRMNKGYLRPSRFRSSKDLDLSN
jgi:uncharacterized protein